MAGFMSRFKGLCVGVAALAALAQGCDAQVGAVPRDEAAPVPQQAPARPETSRLIFDGRLVPTQATDLRAPQNSFSFRNWSSSSSWIKLVDIEPEGKEVKAGEPVARFEFRGMEARHRIQEGIDNARAQLSSSDLTQRQALDQLTTSLRQQEIDVRQAELETQKEGLVSERTLNLSKMAWRQAAFEAEASRRLITVQRTRMASERDYFQKELDRAQADMARFDSIKGRFAVVAPHDGVVRHGFMRRQRRKVEKGDGMPSGYQFASIARDGTVSVEFFVPEQHMSRVKVGAKVTVVAAAIGEEREAVVESVERFPQEVGFLRDNEELPNAREKAYVVRAVMASQSEKMKAGLEVKVHY